jgi:hypothetical protein
VEEKSPQYSFYVKLILINVWLYQFNSYHVAMELVIFCLCNARKFYKLEKPHVNLTIVAFLFTCSNNKVFKMYSQMEKQLIYLLQI